MRIISKKRLREFWLARKHDSEIAKRDLSTCQVGDCLVFDVGNNRFRLIGRLRYSSGILYVLRVMDHAEYDKQRWIEDCGCYKPPPKKPAPGRRKRRR